MAEMESNVPTLTLEPTEPVGAPGAMAELAKSAVEEDAKKEAEAAKQAERDANAIHVNEDMLTEE